MRLRLEQRRRSLDEIISKAKREGDQVKAAIYAQERSEVAKVVKVVTVSELAITQVIARLESIRDVGDLTQHMRSAFAAIKKIGKTVSGLMPALENATNEVNNTLVETMAELSNISPTITLNLNEEDPEEVVGKALQLAEEKVNELGEIPSLLLSAEGDNLVEKAVKIPIPAGGAPDGEEFGPLVLSTPRPRGEEVAEMVYDYIQRRGRAEPGKIALELGLREEEVRDAMIRLIVKGRLQPAPTARRGELP
jgi:division protein CdvB (Snf7/Vps24/ESCRT-III family)